MTFWIVGFDGEGPLVITGVDLAWLIIDDLKAQGKINEEQYQLVKKFDTDYDDARWAYEREQQGWCTGSIPPLAIQMAVAYGVTKEDLLTLIRQKFLLNTGVEQIIGTVRAQGIEPLIISNAWPGLPLQAAKTLGIPSCNVYTSGIQLGSDQIRNLEKQGLMWSDREIEARSELGLLQPHDEVKTFLEKYLPNTSALADAYIAKDAQKIETLLEQQEDIFASVKPVALQDTLRAMIQKQDMVMAAHNKARVLVKRAKEARIPLSHVIYTGDSKVDTDPIAVVNKARGWGIAVNCTNKEALQACSINIVVQHFELAASVYWAILDTDGRIAVEKLKEDFSSDELQIFTPADIIRDLDKVRKANRAVKEQLRAFYEKTLKTRAAISEATI